MQRTKVLTPGDCDELYRV